jgi:hypothetical protein
MLSFIIAAVVTFAARVASCAVLISQGTQCTAPFTVGNMLLLSCALVGAHVLLNKVFTLIHAKFIAEK